MSGEKDRNGTTTFDSPIEDAEKPTSNIEFDDIIESIGTFGYWQRVIFVLIAIFDVYAAFAVLLPVFTGDVPEWYCKQYEGSNITFQRNESFKTCEHEGQKCVQFEFVDSFTSIVSEWDLVCDQDYVSDLITTFQGVGLLIGAAVFGQMSDLLGRKLSWFIANVVMLLGGFVSALVPSWGWYAAARGVVGIGFGANMVVACVYPLEFVGRQWRVLCGTIGFWSLGCMALGLLGYLLRDWKHLTMLTTSTGVLLFLTLLIIPESPRWLNQHGKYEKAQKVLKVIAERNKRPVPTMDMLKRAAAKDLAEENRLKRYTYIDLFRFKTYAVRTIILIALWFTAFVLYYMHAFNMKNLSGDRYMNMVYGGLVDLVAQLSPIFFLTVIGRRFSMILYLGSGLACLIGILVVLATHNEERVPDAILAFALIGKSAALGSTFVCQIFTAELYPTVIRNVGVGMGSVAARIATVSAPQFVYWSTISRLGPYITFSVLSILCLPLSLLLPETKGKPLVDSYPNKKSSDGVYQDDNQNKNESSKL